MPKNSDTHDFTPPSTPNEWRRAGSGLRVLLDHVTGRIGRRWFDSTSYWKNHYAHGGNSGPGSYGRLAEFKADVINAFVEEHGIDSVVEFGSGDGNQLSLYRMPRYVGFDVSLDSIVLCRERFADDSSKSFHLVDQVVDPHEAQADLAMSIDVLFHLTEDSTFDAYMRRLFASGNRFVIIYSSNVDRNRPFQAKHVKHRRFTDWVEASATDWHLQSVVKNKYPLKTNDKIESICDFFIYGKKSQPDADSSA